MRSLCTVETEQRRKLDGAKQHIAEQQSLAQTDEPQHRDAMVMLKMTQIRELQQKSESIDALRRELESAKSTECAAQSNLKMAQSTNERLREESAESAVSLGEKRQRRSNSYGEEEALRKQAAVAARFKDIKRR